MSKKLIFLISLIVVWGVALPSPAADDPNLVGWWRFDGDTLDSSGNGHSGTLAGDAKLVPLGLIGGALELDGNGDYVTIDGYKGVLADAGGVQQPFTITAWVKTTDSGDRTIASWGTNSSRLRVDFRLAGGKLRVEHGAGNVLGNTALNNGEWHHVGLTMIQGATISYPDVKLWLDGKDDTKASTDPDAFSITAGVDMAIGYRATAAARYFLGTIDEVRLYNRLLDASEVADLAKRPKSYDPNPADGAMVEDVLVQLQWTPGGFAVEHDVYFGTNPAPGPAELVGRQTAASYMAVGLLPEQTYYWRVDDVKADGTTVTGDVWSFSVPPKRAYNPQPEDGLINVATDVDLSWAAGWSPVRHAVYFGTDADHVANAIGATWQTTVGFDPGPLALDTTYYWRVDELYALGLAKGPVWSFKTLPPVPLTEDPNLVAWYRLDEGGGKTAIDWSGHNANGKLTGNIQWVEGTVGGAVQFDGSGGDYFEAPESSRVMGTRSRTVAAWIKTADYGEIVSWGQNVAGQKWLFRVQESNGTLGALRIEVNGGYQVGNIDVRDNEWHHVAAVLADDGSPDATEIAFYVDDAPDTISAQQDEPINTAAGPVRIGESPWHNRPFDGLIDDVRIYDKAFTAEEIRQVLGNPLLAYNPQPAAGAVGDVWRLASLSWTAGDGAVEHDVYLGTSKAAVAAAEASDTTGIYRGRQAQTTHIPADGLAFETAYFWRIDEIAADGTISKGRIWTFTTTDNIVLYDVETPFPYDNSVPPYVSEISLDLDPAQDWTDPIGRLAISYTGQAAPGSVTVDDAAGTVTVVGRGADIWGTADQFQFAHTMLTGTGSLMVKVENLVSTDPWTKAGIMIRETLEPGSPFAAVYATGANGVRFQARMAADQSATSDTAVATVEQKALTAPIWLLLVRQFPAINAYYSNDGQNWTPMSWNPQIIPMSPAPIYIGLAVTSHSGADVYAEATFSNVYSSGGVAAGPLTSTEIGLASNAAEPMYLVLENSAGAKAVVYNPDPAAAQQAGLTDWVIDLNEFGLDQTAVTKATLGLGNMDNPIPGGAGLLTINNVRLLARQPVVIWVSDNKTPADGVPADQGWVDLLTAQGYAVDLSFRNQEGRTLDDTKIAALNAADLIIISRDIDSGSYDDGAEPTQWNSITTPILMQIAHIARNNRWLWLDSGSTNDAQPTLQAVATSHPVFNGVMLDANNQANVLTTNSSFVGTTAVGNGTLIATRADNGQVWIAEWQAGQVFYPGSSQTAAGHRMLLCSGGTAGVSDGAYNLTANGEKMFLNAVKFMVSAGAP